MAASLKDEVGTTIVLTLLKNNADANKYRWAEASPLSCAVSAKNIQTVAVLLPHTDLKELIRTDCRNQETGRDPWYVDMMFKASDSIEILTLLKKYGANFNTKNKYGETLLNNVTRSLASYKHNQDYLNKIFKQLCYLIENGANINLADKDGNTPLHILMKYVDSKGNEKSYKEVLTLFINHNANVDAKNKSGETPLAIAEDFNDKIAVEFLKNKDKYINSNTEEKVLSSSVTNSSSSLFSNSSASSSSTNDNLAASSKLTTTQSETPVTNTSTKSTPKTMTVISNLFQPQNSTLSASPTSTIKFEKVKQTPDKKRCIIM